MSNTILEFGAVRPTYRVQCRGTSREFLSRLDAVGFAHVVANTTGHAATVTAFCGGKSTRAAIWIDPREENTK